MVVSSGATVAVVLPSIVEWLFFSKIIIKIVILHPNSQKLFTIFQKNSGFFLVVLHFQVDLIFGILATFAACTIFYYH